MDLFDIRSKLSAGQNIYSLPLRVTYYARVSTDQDAQLHSLSAQVKYYEDFIRNNESWEFIDGYVDEGLSGTSTSKREAFLKMIEDAKLHKFDFIVTKEISRFSRNTLDSIKYTQELLKNGVGVLFQSDNINTFMPDSELRLTIMSSIAQDEVRKISERVKFGFKRSIENGVVLGNDRILGYKKDNGKLVIDEKEAKIVREIFDMYATQNLGIRTISARLADNGYRNSNGNPFSFSTIKYVLTNPKYMGYYCGNRSHKYDYRSNDRKYMDKSDWIMYKDDQNVPPIVSEELWNKANCILSARSKKMLSEDRSSYQNKYVYSGKIVCMEHNVHYNHAVYKYKSGNKEVWHCREYARKGKAGCTSPIIYKSELDEIMKDIYNTIVTQKSSIINDLVKIYTSIDSSSQIQEDIAKYKTQINQIAVKKDKLLELSIDGRLSNREFESRNNAFNSETETLEAKIQDLQEQEQKAKITAHNVEKLRKIIAHELEFENGFDNAVADSLIEKIEVYKSDEKKVINLKIYLNILDECMNYSINRRKNSTSICYNQHI